MRRVATTLVAIAAVWVLYFARANAWFRLYPAIVVFVFLALFASSLFGTPLAEVFARKRAWVVFLLLHFAVTVATVFMSREIWALYNGCIAYLLMGTMFLGEWIVRKRVKRG